MTVDPNDSLEVRVIDAITDYLEGISEIPEHKTVRYKRPIMVIPGEDTPLLSVWLMAKGATPRGTNSYDSALMVGISWQDECVERAVDLMQDPEKYKAELRIMATIQQAIRNLSVGALGASPGHIDAVGVPEAHTIYPMTVDFLPPISLETGLVEGYAMTVEVDVIESGEPKE